MELATTTKERISEQYVKGVKSFVQFAIAVVDEESKIRCPCKKCVNVLRQTGDSVHPFDAYRDYVNICSVRRAWGTSNPR